MRRPAQPALNFQLRPSKRPRFRVVIRHGNALATAAFAPDAIAIRDVMVAALTEIAKCSHCALDLATSQHSTVCKHRSSIHFERIAEDLHSLFHQRSTLDAAPKAVKLPLGNRGR